MIQRRSVLRCGILASIASSVASASAEAYPARPITLFVAFGPGGAGDLVARVVAREMSRDLGQAVIIENRPSPNVASATVARAKPDGYTLVMQGSGTALSTVLFRSQPFDLIRDFAHVSTLAFFGLTLIVAEPSEFKTVAHLLGAMKANPGKLNLGTVRLGSTQNMAAEVFKSMSGVDAVIVPYKSTGDILTALRARDIAAAFEILPPVLSQIKSKLVRPLAVTSAQRFAGLPDVPTLSESGVPSFDVASWNGISVPANTPQPIVDRLSRSIQSAVAAPDVQRQLQAAGVVARSSSPRQMTELLKSDIARWRVVVDKAGIPRQ